MIKLRPERKEDKSGWPWAFEELWFVLRAKWAGFTAEQRPALPHWGTRHPGSCAGEAAEQKGGGLERGSSEG